MPLTVLVACREQAVADAVAAAICDALEQALVAHTTTMHGLLRRAALDRPHVVVLEHRADDDTWAALAAQLQHACPRARVLLLCEGYTPSMLVEFIRLGASGCLLKGSPGAVLARGVQAVHAGEPWFGRRELLEALRSRIAAEPVSAHAMLAERQMLTPRQREILALIGAGMTNKEIGQRLKISDKTVKTHLHRVYVKLHQSGRYKAFVCHGGPAPGIPYTPRASPPSPRFADGWPGAEQGPQHASTLRRD